MHASAARPVTPSENSNSESSRNSTIPTENEKELINAINESHSLVQRKAGEWIEAVRRCGELLLKAKQQMRHGEWGRWLIKNTSFSQDTAENWMRVAENWSWLSYEAYHMGKPSVDRLLKAIRQRKAQSPHTKAQQQLAKEFAEQLEDWDEKEISLLSHALPALLEQIRTTEIQPLADALDERNENSAPFRPTLTATMCDMLEAVQHSTRTRKVEGKDVRLVHSRFNTDKTAEDIFDKEQLKEHYAWKAQCQQVETAANAGLATPIASGPY